MSDNKNQFENEEYVDVNSTEGIEIVPKRKKDDFESYGIEYRKTIVCKKCHEEVDANAEVCPNCGHYVNKNNRRYVPISEKKAWSIKVFLGIICIIIFLVILATK